MLWLIVLYLIKLFASRAFCFYREVMLSRVYGLTPMHLIQSCNPPLNANSRSTGNHRYCGCKLFFPQLAILAPAHKMGFTIRRERPPCQGRRPKGAEGYPFSFCSSRSLTTAGWSSPRRRATPGIYVPEAAVPSGEAAAGAAVASPVRPRYPRSRVPAGCG